MKPRSPKTPIFILLTFGMLVVTATGTLSSVQAQQIQVAAADPPTAKQGSANLNVKVTGKGFKKGARASWFVSGTNDPGGVTVNSTAFVSSTELTANITVSDTASIASFDILVLNSDGRGGKGTELFAVLSGTDVTSTIYDKSVDETTLLQLRSDGLNPDLSANGGTFGTYQTSPSTGVVNRLEGFNNSDWSQHLENSTTRWISLTLNRLSGSGPTGDYSLHGRVISRCFDPSGATTETVSWSSITSPNPNCSMHVNFTLAGVQYALIMSPYYANTGRSLVSCNFFSSGQCVDWSIVPNLTQDTVVNPNPTVANLYSISPRNGKQTFIGTYSFTYRIHVTFP